MSATMHSQAESGAAPEAAAATALADPAEVRPRATTEVQVAAEIRRRSRSRASTFAVIAGPRRTTSQD